MQATVELDGRAAGTLHWQTDAFGVQVTLVCAVPETSSALLRCYGETPNGPMLIGLPEPIGGQLRLTRHLSRETLKAAGCAEQAPTRFYLAVTGGRKPPDEPKPAPPEERTDAESEPPPEKTDTPAVRTGDAVLDALFPCDALIAERHADMVIVRCPFSSDQPFALAPAFVLCEVENGEAVLRCKNEDAAP